MMFSLYVTLGIFLLAAVRKPSANRSLIGFTAWSSLAHAGVMGFQELRHMASRDEMIRESQWEARRPTIPRYCRRTLMPKFILTCPAGTRATGRLRSAGPSWFQKRLKLVSAVAQKRRSERSELS